MEYQFVGWGGRRDAVASIITTLVLFMSVVMVRRILRRRTLTLRRWWRWLWDSVVVGSKSEKIIRNNKRVGDDGERISVEIPKGSAGWPLIGETLDFIACGYTSRPVSFMEKRKSL